MSKYYIPKNELAKITSTGLPTTTADFLAARKTQLTASLNNAVEALILQIVQDEDYGEEYHRLTLALKDEDAVEGACSRDDTIAALHIRKFAAAKGHAMVAAANLDQIAHSHNVALGRYNKSRTQRRMAALAELKANVDETDEGMTGTQ